MTTDETVQKSPVFILCSIKYDTSRTRDSKTQGAQKASPHV